MTIRAFVVSLVAIGILALGGCPDTSCPPGSVEVMGRCVPDDVDAFVGVDAAVARDAGRTDAAAADAPGDLDAPPDACVETDLFVDEDGDAHGDPTRAVRGCPGPGLASVGDDCDDDDRLVFPGAAELCDGADQDCDDASDEGIQHLVGSAILADPDAAPQPLHAGAVGESYLVAYHATGRAVPFVARRFDAMGRPISAVTDVNGSVSEALVRVVPMDALTAWVVIAGGTMNPRTLYATLVNVTTDPLTLVRSGIIGATELPFATSFARSGSDLVMVHIEGGRTYAGSFDTMLARTGGPAPLDVLRDSLRAVYRVSGELVLFATTMEGLVALRLTPRTFAAAAPVVVSTRTDAVPLFGHVTPDGAATISGEGGVLRFDATEIASGSVAASFEPLTFGGAIADTPPSMTGSSAGADLVFGTRDGPVTSLQWRHFERTGGSSSGAPPGADAIPYAAVARLSSRQGALFYLLTTAGDTQLYMQRIGCE